MTAAETIKIAAQPLTAEAFAPYGEVVNPRRVGGQFDNHPYDPETSGQEAQLTLTNGVPRLWIMQLRRNGLRFSTMARHERVTQCLGALQGKDWFIAVASAGKPVSTHDIVAFRVPGDCLIKLHVNTWHAGPQFIHDECLFFNLENLGTNKHDFIAAQLPATVEIVDG